MVLTPPELTISARSCCGLTPTLTAVTDDLPIDLAHSPHIQKIPVTDRHLGVSSRLSALYIWRQWYQRKVFTPNGERFCCSIDVAHASPRMGKRCEMCILVN